MKTGSGRGRADASCLREVGGIYPELVATWSQNCQTSFLNNTPNELWFGRIPSVLLSRIFSSTAEISFQRSNIQHYATVNSKDGLFSKILILINVSASNYWCVTYRILKKCGEPLIFLELPSVSVFCSFGYECTSQWPYNQTAEARGTNTKNTSHGAAKVYMSGIMKWLFFKCYTEKTT